LKIITFAFMALLLILALAAPATTEPAIADGISDNNSSEGGFIISQWTGETWEQVYQQRFQVKYSTEEFAFNAVDGELSLRIVQKDMPFADIDQIRLTACGVDLISEYARYTQDGQSILDDILEIDHNVVLAHEQEMEISWEMPAGCDNATVFLTANEYGHGAPLRFPWGGYATYEMGSNPGSIVVDGLITETDGDTPLYSPFWQPHSGHPDGYTYIYVCDDSENVYFSLDVTGDNTNEYGEDWAELSILTSDGTEQAFRIDDFDDTWGQSGFGLTSTVSYKHQTCEFSIPKTIIGNEDIEFKLSYYGTMMVNISVTKTANPTEVPEPGGPVEFTVRVDNSSGEPVTLTNLTDSIHGNLNGKGDCSCDQSIPNNGYYECSFSANVSGNAGDVETNTVTAVASWDFGDGDTAGDDATVTITDVPSSIEVIKTADPTVVAEPGGSVEFTVRVNNTSTVDSVTIESLSDSIHGDLHLQGDCSCPQTIPVGGYYECSFSANVSGNAGDDETDVVTASGTDDDSNPVSDDGDATVTITVGHVPPIPEMSTIVLLGLSLAAFGGFVWLRRRRAAITA